MSEDESPRRDTSIEALAKLKPVFALPAGEDRGDADRPAPSRRATPPGSRTAPRRRSWPASGPSSASGSSHWRGSSATPRPRSRRSGCSSRRSRVSAGCSTGSSCRSRRSTSSRSTRRSPPRPWPTGGSSASTGTRSTSTVARSPWATRSARAGAHRGDLVHELTAARAATGWRPPVPRRRLGRVASVRAVVRPVGQPPAGGQSASKCLVRPAGSVRPRSVVDAGLTAGPQAWRDVVSEVEDRWQEPGPMGDVVLQATWPRT